MDITKYFNRLEQELVLNTFLIECLENWTSLSSRSFGKKQKEVLDYILSVNLRFLGYYNLSTDKKLFKDDRITKARLIYDNIFSQGAFLEQLTDLNITINTFFPKWYIRNKKKQLFNSIVETYSVLDIENKLKKKVIANFKGYFKSIPYIWILFLIRYYQLYLKKQNI